MRVKQIVLHNFRSYVDAAIDGIDRRCNVVVGRNGQGKSNLHIALMFLFSDSQQGGMAMRRELMSEAQAADSDLYVEAIVSDENDRLPNIEGDTVVRKTVDPEGNVRILVNGKEMKDSEYYGMMEAVGIRRFNPLNFMLQGKVKKVAQADERGLFNMLADVVGTNQYEERRAESFVMMDSVELDEKKATDLLEDFREKLNELEFGKEDYEKYEENLKAGNKIYHTLYSRKVENKTKKRKEAEKNIDTMQSSVIAFREKEQKSEDTVTSSKLVLKEKEKELDLAEKDIAEISTQLMQNELKLTACKKTIADQASQSGESRKDIEAKLTALEKKKNKLADSYKNQQQSLSEVQSSFASSKLAFDHYTTIRDMSAGRSVNDIVEARAKEVEALVSEKLTAREKEQVAVAHYESELRQKESQLKEARKEAGFLDKQLAEIAGHYKKNEEQRTVAEEESLRLKYGLADSKDKVVELEQQVNELKQKIELGRQDANISSIINLLEVAQREQIEGVYGMFADLIEADQSLLFAVELMAKSKMYSIIVRDEKVADDLIRLNKELKGSAIQIYPLTWLPEGSDFQEYPSDDEAIILEKFIKVKDRFKSLQVERLITEILGGCVLVKSYAEAQQTARRYDCSCITMDGQVVYGGGFLAQLGYSDVKRGKLAQFIEMRKKAEELRLKKQAFAKVQDTIDAQKSRELTCSSKSDELKLEMERTRLALESSRDDVLALEKACVTLKKSAIEAENMASQIDRDIDHFKKEIKEMRTSKTINGIKLDKFDEKKFKEIGAELDKQSKQITDRMNSSLSMEKEIHHLEQEADSLRKQAHTATSKDASSSHLEADIIKAEQRHLSDLMEKLKKYLSERKDARATIKAAIETNLQSITKHEEDQKSMKRKLDTMQLQLQQMNQSRFDLQISIDELNTKVVILNVDTEDKDLSKLKRMTDKELIQQLQKLLITKMKYTEKDKANFQRLEDYFRSHNEYESELKDLKDSKKTFYNVVSR